MDLLARVKLRHLRVLLAIDEHRSLRGAAEHVHLSEPAVSSTLRELEEIVERPLFQRRGRIARPTPHGEALIRHARAAVAEIRAANEALSSLDRGAQGALAVGALLVAETELVPEAVARLQQEAPELRIVVRVGEPVRLLAKLRAGSLDLVVGRLERIDGVDASEFAQEVLYTDRTIVVASPRHPLMRRGNPSWDELAQERWVLPKAGSWRALVVGEAFRALGRGLPRCHVDCESHLATLSLIERGGAIGILPERLARQLAPDGRIAEVPVAFPCAFGPVGVIRRGRGTPSMQAQRFVELLRAIAQRASR